MLHMLNWLTGLVINWRTNICIERLNYDPFVYFSKQCNVTWYPCYYIFYHYFLGLRKHYKFCNLDSRRWWYNVFMMVMYVFDVIEYNWNITFSSPCLGWCGKWLHCKVSSISCWWHCWRATKYCNCQSMVKCQALYMLLPKLLDWAEVHHR